MKREPDRSQVSKSELCMEWLLSDKSDEFLFLDVNVHNAQTHLTYVNYISCPKVLFLSPAQCRIYSE